MSLACVASVAMGVGLVAFAGVVLLAAERVSSRRLERKFQRELDRLLEKSGGDAVG